MSNMCIFATIMFYGHILVLHRKSHVGKCGFFSLPLKIKHQRYE